ncbi:MAG: hypothetical protein LBF27_25110 [Sphingobacterium sp.]|nr:hypothetical protein [Sphingobacterium sp.]
MSILFLYCFIFGKYQSQFVSDISIASIASLNDCALIDLLRIEDNKIKEVWLFSEKIADEDAFWNNAAKD